MPRLAWDAVGERRFEVGVDRGVLYTASGVGVPWNGLTAVTESPSAGDATPYYVDGVKYQDVPGLGEFNATIQALTYPDEFAEYDGWMTLPNGLALGSQRTKTFGLSYRTKIGNDVDGTDHAYKIHLVYNALARPTQRNYATLNDSSTPLELSWDITTTPPPNPGYRPSAHLTIDSRTTHRRLMSHIEDQLYGTPTATPRLPSPAELVELFVNFIEFQVVDNGDGSASITGFDVLAPANGRITLSHDNVMPNGDGRVTIFS